jgi:hypothetical protein
MTPTQHKAGSLAKIDLMRIRAANGDPIFVDGDCTDRVSEAEENATKAEVHRRIIEDVDGLRNSGKAAMRSQGEAGLQGQAEADEADESSKVVCLFF